MERTAKVMERIANSIHDQIQVTKDTPERHNDGRMPVLDLKVWVNAIGEIPRVSHTFFKKPVASPYVILKRSAVAGKVKRTTLFQEAIS